MDIATALIIIVIVTVFVFGYNCMTTLKDLYLQFLSLKHPFDVGDRCEVDGVQMTVKERNMFRTVFLRFDNRIVIYPTLLLATTPIDNYFRPDTVEFSIHESTVAHNISLLINRITTYIENNSDDWDPTPEIVLSDVDDMDWVKITIRVSHRINFEDMGERWKRRGLLVRKVIKIFRELDVEYRMLPSTWTQNNR